ncbi:MarR family winged helix-turn-helix transcriptional regulator [Sulfitobacter aestuariivivens]|uniref:MarR family transcriptional regulator n=1 Tax=Sulfitobacter aestuariivivens TaxID=2766981 RepID=A0A927D1Z3_9RHOB|nr:MarR family transcriptional regulator [Sulfitobacter aestuariivivens]MBD3662863.1 MarR family transcriptional regulator [Sulfitobacter aestuariivivens]
MSGSKDRLRLWLRLLKVVRGIEAEVRDRLRREFDTTLPRFDMLAALSRHPDGLKMSHLSGVLRVSNGNVTGLADRLTDEGLVKRVPVPGDRRAMILQITTAGQREFYRQAAAHEDWIDQMLGDVPAAEARAMAERLTAFAAGKEEKEAAHAQ